MENWVVALPLVIGLGNGRSAKAVRMPLPPCRFSPPAKSVHCIPRCIPRSKWEAKFGKRKKFEKLKNPYLAGNL